MEEQFLGRVERKAISALGYFLLSLSIADAVTGKIFGLVWFGLFVCLAWV